MHVGAGGDNRVSEADHVLHVGLDGCIREKGEDRKSTGQNGRQREEDKNFGIKYKGVE